MKTTVKRAALVILTVGALSTASAQKIAHIHLDSLSNLMPETKVAKTVAESYFNDLKKTVSAMEEEFQKKYSDYLQNEPTMSELVKKTKQEELQSLQTRIQDFNQQAQMDYQKKSAELTAPIMEKAKKAIEAVAKEGGYKYVLDTSAGNVLYSETGEDILLAVKKKLDTMPAAVIPGANPEKPKTNPGPVKGKQ
jgi:outer membrane protein